MPPGAVEGAAAGRLAALSWCATAQGAAASTDMRVPQVHVPHVRKSLLALLCLAALGFSGAAWLFSSLPPLEVSARAQVTLRDAGPRSAFHSWHCRPPPQKPSARSLPACNRCVAPALPPPQQAADLAVLRAFPPRTLPALAAQRDVLQAYAVASPLAVAAGFCSVYLLMQTFAIPGTLMLSVLAGGLYGVWRGAALVAVVSTAGSCSCYCLSWALGQPLAHALWPERIDRYAAEVARRRRELVRGPGWCSACARRGACVAAACVLGVAAEGSPGRLTEQRLPSSPLPSPPLRPLQLNYILFLRVTPLLPNTFINVCSPIVGVPLLPFALGA